MLTPEYLPQPWLFRKSHALLTSSCNILVDNDRSFIVKSSFLFIMSVIVEDWNEGQRYSARKLSIFEEKKKWPGFCYVRHRLCKRRSPHPLLTLYRKEQRGKLGNDVEKESPLNMKIQQNVLNRQTQ